MGKDTPTGIGIIQNPIFKQHWKNKSICFFLDKCPVNIKVLELSMPKSYK
jgi:hypothetical protein